MRWFPKPATKTLLFASRLAVPDHGVALPVFLVYDRLPRRPRPGRVTRQRLVTGTVTRPLQLLLPLGGHYCLFPVAKQRLAKHGRIDQASRHQCVYHVQPTLPLKHHPILQSHRLLHLTRPLHPSSLVPSCPTKAGRQQSSCRVRT